MNQLWIGDCRDILKQLKNQVQEGIKAIYVDPPYNTGKQLIFKDNREHREWKKLLQESFTLGRELLSPDGILLCSINERGNMFVEESLNKVFDISNKVGSFIWQMRRGGKSDAIHIATDHEYIKIYAKDIKQAITYRFPLSEHTEKDYKNRDKDPRGPYRIHNMDIGKLGGSTYDIVCPDGTTLHSNAWRFCETKFKSELALGRIFFQQNKKGTWKVYKKIYLSENKQVVRSVLTNCGTTAEASRELEKILGRDIDVSFKRFVYPKPVRLIKKLVEFSTQPGDTVLDFFAGTGTTGQACFETGRKFILVTLAEPIGKSNVVDEITLPRLQKAAGDFELHR